MVGRILAVFLAVVVLGGLLFLYTSGILGRVYKSATGFLPNASSSFFPRFPTSPSLIGGSYPSPYGNTSGGSYSGGTGTGSTISPAPNDIPQGYTARDISPYFHQVRFGGVTPGSPYGNYYGSYGQISLYAYPAGSNASINITDWQVKANRGGFYIPKAVNYYDPLGLREASDIFLKSGDVVYFYSTSAPINLRLNKCIGYLPNKTQFNPALPTTCPYVDRASISQYTGACQNYILSLSSCQLPNLADPRVPQNDYACRDYLDHNFNYRACYDAHVADANFLSNEVRVWTGSTPLDQYHDRVALLDANGLLVDYYSY